MANSEISTFIRELLYDYDCVIIRELQPRHSGVAWRTGRELLWRAMGAAFPEGSSVPERLAATRARLETLAGDLLQWEAEVKQLQDAGHSSEAISTVVHRMRAAVDEVLRAELASRHGLRTALRSLQEAASVSESSSQALLSAVEGLAPWLGRKDPARLDQLAEALLLAGEKAAAWKRLGQHISAAQSEQAQREQEVTGYVSQRQALELRAARLEACLDPVYREAHIGELRTKLERGREEFAALRAGLEEMLRAYEAARRVFEEA